MWLDLIVEYVAGARHAADAAAVLACHVHRRDRRLRDRLSGVNVWMVARNLKHGLMTPSARRARSSTTHTTTPTASRALACMERSSSTRSRRPPRRNGI